MVLEFDCYPSNYSVLPKSFFSTNMPPLLLENQQEVSETISDINDTFLAYFSGYFSGLFRVFYP